MIWLLLWLGLLLLAAWTRNTAFLFLVIVGLGVYGVYGVYRFRRRD